MPRPPAFDRDSAVRAARTLFWQHGYEEASIPALEEATGLSRSSIYHAFGSKRGLFDATIQSYLSEIIRPRLRPLLSNPVPADAARDYITGLREAFALPTSMPSMNGCLLINTAASPLAHDAEITRIVSDYRAELHHAILRGLATVARAETDRQRLADILTGLVIAAFILIRIAPEQAQRSLETAEALIRDA